MTSETGNEKEGSISLEEAKNVLVMEQSRKIRECQEEIQKILEKYGMRMQVRQVLDILPGER